MWHKEGNRYSDKECTEDALKHNEFRFLDAIVETNEAEKEACEQTVYSICLKISWSYELWI